MHKKTQDKLREDQMGAICSDMFEDYNPAPPGPLDITFTNGNQVGILTWADGTFRFEGDHEESAKVFLDYLDEKFMGLNAKVSGYRDALQAIIDRSHNGEPGTSKVIDMRRIAEEALKG